MFNMVDVCDVTVFCWIAAVLVATRPAG